MRFRNILKNISADRSAYFYRLLVGSIFLVQLVVILRNDTRYYFDMQYYVATAKVIHESLRQTIFNGKIMEFLLNLQTDFRPSLYYMPGVFFLLPFAFNIKTFLLINYISVSLLCWIIIERISRGTYLPIREAWLLFFVSPLVVNYARYPMVEYPLYCLVGLSVSLFIVSTKLHNSIISYLFIIISAVGMMYKFSFWSFALIPALFLLAVDFFKKGIKDGIKSTIKAEAPLRAKQIIVFVFIFAALMFIFAGPRYLLSNYDHYIKTEIAAYWSYPYKTIFEKIWWFFVAPTQILTLPILFFSVIALLYKQEIGEILIFYLVPLMQFAFMDSKGARLFGSVVFPLCLLAAIGISKVKNNLNKSEFVTQLIISLFVIINLWGSVSLNLDHPPAFVYPEGGKKDIFKGFTPQLVSHGQWDSYKDYWKKAEIVLSKMILESAQSKNPTVVYLYYTAEFLPSLNLPEGSVQIVHELLWPEAQTFPIDYFSDKDVFFAVKTDKFTHWVDNGSGLEMERHLRYLTKQFLDSKSDWRVNTRLVGQIALPDNTKLLLFKRIKKLTENERIVLIEKFLSYDRNNGINIPLASEVVNFYTVNNQEEFAKLWQTWIKNAYIHPSVRNLISKKERDNILKIKSDKFL